MAKKLIKTDFYGQIVEGRLTAVRVVENWEVSDVDGDMHPKRVDREATPEELALIAGESVATLTAANKEVNDLNTELQAQMATREAEFKAVIESLNADMAALAEQLNSADTANSTLIGKIEKAKAALA